VDPLRDRAVLAAQAQEQKIKDLWAAFWQQKWERINQEVLKKAVRPSAIVNRVLGVNVTPSDWSYFGTHTITGYAGERSVGSEVLMISIVLEGVTITSFADGEYCYIGDPRHGGAPELTLESFGAAILKEHSRAEPS
jgi:hypothetical protein